jgi:hypothetical protein
MPRETYDPGVDVNHDYDEDSLMAAFLMPAFALYGGAGLIAHQLLADDPEEEDSLAYWLGSGGVFILTLVFLPVFMLICAACVGNVALEVWRRL